MQLTRRTFLVAASGVTAAVGAFFSNLLVPFRSAGAAVGWSVRRATNGDAAALRDIFNAQLGAGLFPFSDRIEPWSVEKSQRVLDVYTGTLVLEHDGNVVGFVAFVDYTRAGTQSSIVPEADPEVKILAVRVDQLTYEQRLVATKRLALAASRDLRRQGFKGCEATIHAQTGFQNLFAGNFEVKHVNERNGLAEAKRVRFHIGDIIEELEAEGL